MITSVTWRSNQITDELILKDFWQIQKPVMSADLKQRFQVSKSGTEANSDLGRPMLFSDDEVIPLSNLMSSSERPGERKISATGRFQVNEVWTKEIFLHYYFFFLNTRIYTVKIK